MRLIGVSLGLVIDNERCVVVVMVVVVVQGDYPQPSTPLPCFIDVTIKPGGRMALKLHGGPSLAVLALTQFNFCPGGHRKYVSITLSSPGGLQAPSPRAITAVIDQSCREKKKLTEITKGKKFNSYVSDIMLSQSVPCQQPSRRGVCLQSVLHV